jgi:hypothetical protein
MRGKEHNTAVIDVFNLPNFMTGELPLRGRPVTNKGGLLDFSLNEISPFLSYSPSSSLTLTTTNRTFY